MKFFRNNKDLLTPGMILGMAAYGGIGLGISWKVGQWLARYPELDQPYRFVGGFYYTLYRYLVDLPFLVPIKYFASLQPTPFPVINFILTSIPCVIWAALFGYVLMSLFIRGFTLASYSNTFSTNSVNLFWRLFFVPLGLAIVYAIGSGVLHLLFFR